MLAVDGRTIDLGRCRIVASANETIELTPREAGLIRFLHQNRTRTVGRGELLEKVWRAPATMQTRTVDMTIANLRKKIERDPRAPRIVISVKGLGYRWGADEDPEAR